MLIDFNSSPSKYWINNGSPKSYLVERILLSSNPKNMQRIDVENRQIRYVDWLVPGILGMNMMFGCLFGIGYVIVHYRKTGYLKRISATPIRAIEFLSAQIGSRLVVTMITSTIVYIGTKLIIGFPMQGSYFNLILIAMLGSVSMSSLGLVFAARVSNEELANGLINIILWPMMLLSGVWFSLEGLPDWAQSSAQLFPLMHLIEGARKIMFDGAGLIDISHNIMALIIMSSLFLTLGAAMFKWSDE
jgi:ABC-type multidrug transport system permease subunit